MLVIPRLLCPSWRRLRGRDRFQRDRAPRWHAARL